MKNISIATLCFVFAAGFTPVARAQVPLAEMTDTISQQGIAAFVDRMRSSHWKTPFIPSKWYMENIADDAARKDIATAREFGRELAKALSAYAADADQQLPAQRIEDKAKLLLDLSDWCAGNQGVGNVLLAQRCYDIASIFQIRLVADLVVPLKTVTELDRRFSLTWLNATARASILNREAGASLFAVANFDEIRAQQHLEKVWSSGLRLLFEKKHPDQKAVRMAAGKDVTDKFIDSDLLAEKLGFFIDDIYDGKGRTLEHEWDRKWHQRLVNGLDSQNVKKAHALLEFRSMVGDFPTQDNPSSPWRGGLGAFAVAWQEKIVRTAGMTNEDWNVYRVKYAVAWTAFEELQQGAFKDADSRNAVKD